MGHLVEMPNFVAKKKMRLVPSSDSQLVKEKHSACFSVGYSISSKNVEKCVPFA